MYANASCKNGFAVQGVDSEQLESPRQDTATQGKQSNFMSSSILKNIFFWPVDTVAVD